MKKDPSTQLVRWIEDSLRCQEHGFAPPPPYHITIEKVAKSPRKAREDFQAALDQITIPMDLTGDPGPTWDPGREVYVCPRCKREENVFFLNGDLSCYACGPRV